MRPTLFIKYEVRHIAETETQVIVRLIGPEANDMDNLLALGTAARMLVQVHASLMEQVQALQGGAKPAGEAGTNGTDEPVLH